MECLKKSHSKMEYKVMVRSGSLVIGIAHAYESSLTHNMTVNWNVWVIPIKKIKAVIL